MTRSYQLYLQEIFCSVMKEILADVAENGTDEYFSHITFQTNRKDVKIPDFVRAKYPQKIQINLKEHAKDLVVSKSSFSIILTVDDISSTITVPFEALTEFYSSGIMLSFVTLEEENTPLEPKEKDIPVNFPSQPSEIIDLTSLRNKK